VQKDIQAEVILCSNCNEDVPKTLYCLNCGYPLYKVEHEQAELERAETLVAEETPERIELEPAIEPDIPSFTEEGEEVPVDSITEVVDEEEPLEFSVDEAEHVAEPVELVEGVTEQGEIEPAAMEAKGPENLEENYVSELDVITSEEEPFEIIEDAVVEEVEEDEEDEVEVVEEIREEPIAEEPMEEDQEMPAEFEPDPLITVVMERVAKNISLKVRLVNLLIEDDVKESTFNRLFESYAAKGERWINRRNEMLERNRYDLESMEKALTETGMNLEELGIRRAIGDASEEEHEAKAPAFEWDIQLLERDLQRTKGENAYLEDLTRVMSAEDVQGLKEMAEGCHGALDGLVETGKISSETAVSVKATLEDALDCLKESGGE